MKYRDHEREVKRLLAEQAATLRQMRERHAQEVAALQQQIKGLEGRMTWLESKLRQYTTLTTVQPLTPLEAAEQALRDWQTFEATCQEDYAYGWQQVNALAAEVSRLRAEGQEV